MKKQILFYSFIALIEYTSPHVQAEISTDCSKIEMPDMQIGDFKSSDKLRSKREVIEKKDKILLEKKNEDCRIKQEIELAKRVQEDTEPSITTTTEERNKILLEKKMEEIRSKEGEAIEKKLKDAFDKSSEEAPMSPEQLKQMKTRRKELEKRSEVNSDGCNPSPYTTSCNWTFPTPKETPVQIIEIKNQKNK